MSEELSVANEVSVEETPVVALASVLDRIDNVKRVKTDHPDAKHEDKEVIPFTSSSIDINAAGSLQPPQWYEFVDDTSGKSYYHNYTTNETSWETPESFVPFSRSYPTTSSSMYMGSGLASTSTDYSTTAYFNSQDGRFGGVGNNHWEQVSSLPVVSFSCFFS
jgi:hypothetical protein